MAKKKTAEKKSAPKKIVNNTTKKTVKKIPTKKKAAAKPIKAKKKEAVISSSNVKERTSRSNFELVMTPWVCVPTGGPTDNGHDYNVQIISPKGLKDYKSDGKFFLVQLKSQEKLTIKEGFVTPHPVETIKIRQWYNSSSQLPFMFVVNDLVKNNFYYTWIDEEFISSLERTSPFWIKQETVSFKIPISHKVTKEVQETIREYVFNYKQITKKLLEPGVFFDMKEKVTEAINIYYELVKMTPYDSVKEDVEKLKSDLQNAVYRIAITGLSRVGKSSLINNLLKRPDISPADVWQTTGVPILIQPGREEKLQINFIDPRKQSEVHDYSSELIKQYAAREYNEDNYKGVRDVSVFISSTQLERGVMFYDIPGLNDPNDAILDYAYHTSDCANAIIYIIDGAGVASGSFIFSNEIKKQIERFSKKDRVFLVINKVDRLTPDELSGLQKEIDRNLDKYNLRDLVAEKIYYLAIDPKLTDNLERLKDSISTPAELEKDLWAFMLTENKVGFFKLYSLMRELQQSSKNLEGIIRTRSLDAKGKKQLDVAMTAVNKKVPELQTYIHSQQKRINKIVKNNLELRKNGIIEGLEDFLDKASNMPTDEAITDFLVTNGHTAVGSTKADVENELSYMKDYIDNWIEDNLKQVREIIALDSQNVGYSLKEVEEIKLPAFDFSSAWGTGILAAIAGFIINPVIGSFGIGLGIGGALLDLIFGTERRKEKRIRKLTQRARTQYGKAFTDVELSFNAAVNEQISTMIQYVNRKLKLYFGDIDKQINSYKLDKNFDYLAFESNSKEKITEINKNLTQVWEELQMYLVVIRPMN